MKKALIVVDMLNDFLSKDGALYCGDKAREIIPFVKEKVTTSRKEGTKIIYVADTHDPDDAEFKMFPKHCVAGSEGNRLIPELTCETNDYRVPKRRYSAFFDTDLEGILKREGIEQVEVVGACTSICVLYTVADLRNRDYPVTVYREGVADFDPEQHEFALKHIEKVLGAKVV